MNNILKYGNTYMMSYWKNSALKIYGNNSILIQAKDYFAAVFCEQSSPVGSGCRGHFSERKGEIRRRSMIHVQHLKWRIEYKHWIMKQKQDIQHDRKVTVIELLELFKKVSLWINMLHQGLLHMQREILMNNKRVMGTGK